MSVVESWSRLARRRWRTGLAVFAAVVATGAAVVLLSRPIHRSEAALRLGDPPPPVGVSPTGGIMSLFQRGDAFANDLELLASRTLAERVVEDVALSAELVAPAGWHRDSLLSALSTTRETEEATFAARWEDGGIAIRMISPRDSAIGRVAPGVAARFGGVSAVFLPWRNGMPREVQIATSPFAEAVRSTRSALDVERPRREANVVALAYEHTDPGVANGVVTAVVDAFVRLRTALHHRESGQTVDSLRAVAERTAAELRDAEERMVALQRDSRLVAPEAQSEVLVERHGATLTLLEQARSELAAVDEMTRRLEAARESPRAWTPLLGYPAFFENQTLGGLLTRLTELHAQRAELSSRRTTESRQLQVIDRQIAYVDASLRELSDEYRVGLAERIASLEPQVAALEAGLAQLPGSAIDLARLQRRVRLLSEVMLITEQRLRQEELREALTYSNVQVIDPPALRDRPVWPRKKLGLAVALLLATGFGMMGMVVRERTDPRVRRVAQLREALGRPVLAVLRAGPEGLDLSQSEAESLLRRAGSGGNGRKAMTLVVADEGGRRVVRSQESGGGPEAPAAADGVPAVRIRAVGPIRDFADAVEVSSAGAAVVLMVEAGRTTVAGLRASARLIVEAGGEIAGAVLVCGPGDEEDAAWG